MKTYNTNYAVGKPYGNFTIINRGTDLEFREGRYVSKYGVVTIYSKPNLASFSFVYLGRCYTLNLYDFKNQLTNKQLTVRAGKFSRSIVLAKEKK